MKFHLFQALLKKTLSQLSCSECLHHEITDADITLLEISSQHFTISVTCPKCGHTTYVSSGIGIRNTSITPQKIPDWLSGNAPLPESKKEPPIEEKEILSIHKKIKDNDISAEAFFENL